jgi:hypothetical protein
MRPEPLETQNLQNKISEITDLKVHVLGTGSKVRTAGSIPLSLGPLKT